MPLLLITRLARYHRLGAPVLTNIQRATLGLLSIVVAAWFLSWGSLTVAKAQPRPITADPKIVCPETLPNDDARRAAARRFVERYGIRHPHSHMGQRLAARARLLRQRGCRPETLHHDFPET